MRRPVLPSRAGRSTAVATLALILGMGLTACADQSMDPTDADLSPDAPALSRQQGSSPFVEGRVLARFGPGANGAAVAAAAGASIQRDLVLDIQVLSVPAGREVAVANALSRNPNVEFAEPDYVRVLGEPATMPVNDPYIGYKWDLDNDGSIYDSQGNVLASTGAADADMDWREAVEAAPSSGGTARIGIMDTGIRNDHEEFTGRIAVQYDFYDNDSNAEDDYGHGTHVAGIAAAATDNNVGTAGVAYTGTVDFAIAKVCGRSNPGPHGYGCPSSAIANGIVWAVDNGAVVLNMSLGGTSGSTATQSALQYARSHNVLPLCATGNENGPVSYPGAWPECVAVGATDWSDNRASYSNYGPEIELSAPGGDDENADGYSYILSSYYDSPTSYTFMAGTSMATPQVTGLAALLNVFGVADDDAKLANMKSTADDLGAAGWDQYFGAGRINVAAAVAAASGGGTTNSPPMASFTYSCTDLACDFDAGGSSDSDGSIASYDWTFGDGATATGAATSHTYAAGGTYTVTMTVTDDGGATDADAQDVTVTEPSSGGITLTATGYKNKGRHAVDLSWTGATSTNVDIFRNGSLLTTTGNDGAYTDATSNRGGATYTYQVCEAGTSTCSNEATVVF